MIPTALGVPDKDERFHWAKVGKWVWVSGVLGVECGRLPGFIQNAEVCDATEDGLCIEAEFKIEKLELK